MFELRAMKSPKHVLEAHQGEAITCIAEQNSVKVRGIAASSWYVYLHYIY